VANRIKPKTDLFVALVGDLYAGPLRSALTLLAFIPPEVFSDAELERLYRKEQLTQQEIAERVGVTGRTIVRWMKEAQHHPFCECDSCVGESEASDVPYDEPS